VSSQRPKNAGNAISNAIDVIWFTHRIATTIGGRSSFEGPDTGNLPAIAGGGTSDRENTQSANAAGIL
jgi:hypothetical protein